MRKIVIVLIILFQIIGLLLIINNILGVIIISISIIVSILLIVRKRECDCLSRYEDPATNQWVCNNCGRRYLSKDSK